MGTGLPTSPSRASTENAGSPYTLNASHFDSETKCFFPTIAVSSSSSASDGTLKNCGGESLSSPTSIYTSTVSSFVAPRLSAMS